MPDKSQYVRELCGKINKYRETNERMQKNYNKLQSECYAWKRQNKNLKEKIKKLERDLCERRKDG